MYSTDIPDVYIALQSLIRTGCKVLRVQALKVWEVVCADDYCRCSPSIGVSALVFGHEAPLSQRYV